MKRYMKEYGKNWRINHKEKCKEYKRKYLSNHKQKQYYNLESRREYQKEYQKTYAKPYREKNREKLLNYQKEWKKNNQEKIKEYNEKYDWSNASRKYFKNHPEENYKFKARDKARKKIKINNQICENCKLEKAKHRHHIDYNEPLNVVLLCRKCHREIHKKLCS